MSHITDEQFEQYLNSIDSPEKIEIIAKKVLNKRLFIRILATSEVIGNYRRYGVCKYDPVVPLDHISFDPDIENQPPFINYELDWWLIPMKSNDNLLPGFSPLELTNPKLMGMNGVYIKRENTFPYDGGRNV